MTAPRVGGCVLAAGAGRRMGAGKALAPLGAATFLETLLATLALARIAPRLVVVRGEALAAAGGATLRDTCARHDARLLINPEPDRGMLSSIHVGLDALEDDADAGAVAAFLIAPVDCPRVRAATIGALTGAFASTGAPIVVPRFAGRRGHPALFARALFGELRGAPLDVGARAVVGAHAAVRLEIDVDDPAVLDDFDDAPPPAR